MSNIYVNDFNTTVKTYYKDLKSYKPLSREQERELFKKARKNNLAAKNKLITSNLKFVFDVAKTYKGCGVDMEDLISEGNLGLTKAFEKYDEDRDVKFISYAVWWIKQSIQCFIKNKQRQRMHETSNDEFKITCDIECEIPDYEDDIVSFKERIMSNKIDQETDELTETQREMINKLLTKLTPRGALIIEYYFGLNGKEELTLDEIGEKVSLTKERVRQIKEKCIRIIRSELLLMKDCDIYY